MEMKDFLEVYKAAKSCPSTLTGFFKIKARSGDNKKSWELFRVEECKYCGHWHEMKVVVKLHEPHHLSIFQAEMMFALFGLKKRPADYASYHKCFAGQEFIKNIKSVEVN